MRTFCGSLCILLTAICLAGNPSNPITTGTLFEEMADMRALTRFPDPSYTMLQYSSYDHRSTLPGGPHWFANSDGFGGEPVPNFEKVLKEPDAEGVGEYLIADTEGPGAIVRVWTAAIAGTIRLFIDDIETPLVECEANTFFHNPYSLFDQYASIDKEVFEGNVVQRDASYAPIPFARRMRLEWKGNLKEIHFYQMQVRLYEKSADVRSFKPEDIRTYSRTIDRISRILSDPDQFQSVISSREPLHFSGSIEPGKSTDILSLKDPGALERLAIKLSAENHSLALRQTVLHIHCDDYPWGQVQSPVGDFFGAAPGINPYQSMPFTVKADGLMISRYVMPFEKNCIIRLTNMGKQTVHVEGDALVMAYQWDASSMHFRARWRADHELIADPGAVQDLPFLLAWGKGIYVGSVSLLMNPSAVPTPYGSWWGEGDEKVFVDNGEAPCLFGTGSEDYYNYSWSVPEIFIHPYCGQPRNDGPGNRGFVTNYRYHILDPIPFEKSIRFFMELYSHEVTPGLSYARIAYHYARPGLTDDHMAIMPEDVRPLRMPENYIPAMRMGARNSVYFNAESHVTDKKNTDLVSGTLWEKNGLLVWKPEKMKARKTFRFQVDEAGKIRIHCVFRLSPGSGRIAFRLDNEPAMLANKSEVLDLSRDFRTLSRNFTLVPVELKKGRHTLTLEYRGANDTITAPEIGFDFFWVQNIK